jgi:hypothetical protein
MTQSTELPNMKRIKPGEGRGVSPTCSPQLNVLPGIQLPARSGLLVLVALLLLGLSALLAN